MFNTHLNTQDLTVHTTGLPSKPCFHNHCASLSLTFILSHVPEPPKNPQSEKLQQLSRFSLSWGLEVFPTLSTLRGLKASVFCLDFGPLAFLSPWVLYLPPNMTQDSKDLVLPLRLPRSYRLNVSKYNSLCFWIYSKKKKKKLWRLLGSINRST